MQGKAAQVTALGSLSAFPASPAGAFCKSPVKAVSLLTKHLWLESAEPTVPLPSVSASAIKG